jgi:hypothetical protein
MTNCSGRHATCAETGFMTDPLDTIIPSCSTWSASLVSKYGLLSDVTAVTTLLLLSTHENNFGFSGGGSGRNQTVRCE